MSNLIKKEFQVKDLVNEYKNELQRTYEDWDNKQHRSTRKSRLKRIRLELDEENNYRDDWYINEVAE